MVCIVALVECSPANQIFVYAIYVYTSMCTYIYYTYVHTSHYTLHKIHIIHLYGVHTLADFQYSSTCMYVTQQSDLGQSRKGEVCG